MYNQLVRCAGGLGTLKLVLVSEARAVLLGTVTFPSGVYTKSR